jgi:branched-chain amino acid transport system permease protein
MKQLAQILVDAATIGSLFSLSALGIGLIFGIMGLVNFAHGELIMVGAYSLLIFIGLWSPLTLIASCCLVIALAIVMERVAFRPVRNSDSETLLITSFAVSMFLQNLFIILLGARPISIDFAKALAEPVLIGDIRVPRLNLVTVIVTAVLLSTLAAFMKYTRYGVQMRAAAADFNMARLLGVKANFVISLAFAMSGFLAATVSFLLVAQTGLLSPAMGGRLVLVGFVATVLGGMGSLAGAVLGGLIIGVITVLFQSLLPLGVREFRDAFVYMLVFLILVVRPQGLLKGRREGQRV